ncbi:MAG: PSD1 domain-containing protein [Bryobacterales bacterium]|nr:PSD1 domain-containing protein [Bryobacterales bacterium]
MRPGLLFLLLAALPAWADPAGAEFFEKRVRPVLATRCFACHGPAVKEPRGGLRLGTKAGLARGGDSGPALVPGDPSASRLIRAIRYGDPRLQMPPKAKLPDAEIAALEEWIALGAPDPREDSQPQHSARGIDWERARRHWAFRPLRPPAGAFETHWLAKLTEKGLSPSAEADRRTLLRRATFALTGLPPTPEEVDAFVGDPAPDAWERVIDRLLASPHYGERWARHWLDLVRFAETDGHEFDVDKPNAWRYRDAVIRAFNRDTPYNRFVRLQLAGDLTPQEPDALILSAFPWLGEVINTPVDSDQALVDRVDNQIDVFGKAVLGLTVACARCHDHKFDPIPASDYYALAGIFRSVRPRQTALNEGVGPILAQIRHLDGGTARPGTPPEGAPGYRSFTSFLNGKEGWKGTGLAFESEPQGGLADSARLSARLQGILISPQFRIRERYIHVRMGGRGGRVRLFADEYTSRGRTLEAPGAMRWMTIDARMGQGNWAYLEISDLNPQGGIAVDQVVFSDRKEPPPWSGPQPEERWRLLSEAGLAQRRALEAQIPAETEFALTTVEDEPRNVPVLIRGNPHNPGAIVPRRFLTVFSGVDQPPPGAGSGRRELLERLFDDAEPLVARVAANRVWHYLFGTGLVASTDNFGVTGDRPSHPELLDLLATRLIANGWSLKALQREILRSRLYRMASTADPRAAETDPRNALLHHFPVRRLEAEALRDNLLAVAGTLDRTQFGPSVPPYVSPFMDSDPRGKPVSGPLDGANRRSIYLQVRRNFLTDMFLTFDYPQPITTIGRRNMSTVSSQALYFMNSGFVRLMASRWASRLTAEPEDRVRQMYEEAFGRPPESDEQREAAAFLGRMHAAGLDDPQAWTEYAHALLNTAEFLYVR